MPECTVVLHDDLLGLVDCPSEVTVFILTEYLVLFGTNLCEA